jgi:hypothetical protein
VTSEHGRESNMHIVGQHPTHANTAEKEWMTSIQLLAFVG